MGNRLIVNIEHIGTVNLLLTSNHILKLVGIAYISSIEMYLV